MIIRIGLSANVDVFDGAPFATLMVRLLFRTQQVKLGECLQRGPGRPLRPPCMIGGKVGLPTPVANSVPLDVVAGNGLYIVLPEVLHDFPDESVALFVSLFRPAALALWFCLSLRLLLLAWLFDVVGPE